MFDYVVRSRFFTDLSIVFGPLLAPFWLPLFDDFRYVFRLRFLSCVLKVFELAKCVFLMIVGIVVLKVFVCAGPSKRKGRNSKTLIKPLCFSCIFKMRGFEMLIEIHTSKVHFSSRRRRPFRHRFFICFS